MSSEQTITEELLYQALCKVVELLPKDQGYGRDMLGAMTFDRIAADTMDKLSQKDRPFVGGVHRRIGARFMDARTSISKDAPSN